MCIHVSSENDVYFVTTIILEEIARNKKLKTVTKNEENDIENGETKRL